MRTEQEARAFLTRHYPEPRWTIEEYSIRVLMPTTDPGDGVYFIQEIFDDAHFDIQVVAAEPEKPHQVIRVRGRQSGKTHELATKLSAKSGLTVETCEELIRSGFRYYEYNDGEKRWWKP